MKMKVKKRAISLFLSLTMIISIFTCFNFAVSAKSYPQVSEAYEVLTRLNISSLKYNEETENTMVTREEFAVIVANAVNAPEVEEIRFIDVDTTDENMGKLSGLYDMGIISGYERMFNPDRPVTAGEAAVMMMNATGRGGKHGADAFSLARDLNVIPSAVGKTSNITVGQALQMAYQMMKINTMEVIGFEGDDVKYKDTGKTLFEMYFDVEIVEGFIDAISGTCLNKEINLKENEFGMDGERYTLSYDADMSAVLGQNMRVIYVEKSDDTKSVVYMTPYKDYESKIIENDDYLGFDFNSYSMNYYVNGTNEKTAKISRDARFVYNGERIKENIKDLMDSLNGENDNLKITLRDTDGQDGFDLVVIEKYTNVYLTAIDKTEYILHGTIAGNAVSVNVSEDDIEYVSIVKADGEKMDFADIATDAVISVFESRDKNHIRVVYSTKVVSGAIENRDYDEHTFVIEEQTYNTDSNAWTELENAKSGDSYSVYIDAYGKAVKFVLDKTGSKIWGYLIKADASYSEDIITLKILAQDNTVKEYTLADKIKIDGISYKNESAEILIQKLGEVKNAGNKVKVQQQVLRFKVNSEGKITWLDTLNYNALEDPNDAVRKNKEEHSTTVYAGYSKRFGFKTIYDSNTIIFNVPTVNEDGKLLNGAGVESGAVEDGDYKVITANFVNNGWYNNICGYSIKADAAVQDVLVVMDRGGTLTSGSNSTLAVVNKIMPTLNSDDEVTVSVEAIAGGAERVYQLTSTDVAEDISVGDLVEFAADWHDRVSYVKKYYDYALDKTFGFSQTYQYTTSDSYNANFQISTGYVQDIENGYVKICYDKTAMNKIDEIIDLNSVNIIVHDKSLSKDSTYVGTVGDIPTYKQVGTNCARIFIQTNQTQLKSVIVYK